MNRTGVENSLPPDMPWDRKPSILEHIRAHIDPAKPGLLEGGNYLPDEEQLNSSSKLRWAPGAFDGVLTHHMGSGDNQASIQRMVELVLNYSQQPTTGNKLAVYQHIVAEHIVSVIDPVIQALLEETRINHERLYELADSFASESPDREPVKFGVAILGLYRNPANFELFQALGRHDEFTLYSAVALGNADDAPDELLWTLARNVFGWGRIHLVERLAQTEDPRIKDWLLRAGYNNSVMIEYLACTCARAGGLLLALSGDEVDHQLLTSAGEIIRALISGGPAEGIDDYEDARPVLESFVYHLGTSADTVADFLSVVSIKDFLDQEDDWEQRYTRSWSPDARANLRVQCERILLNECWPDRVRVQLHSTDELEFFHANRAATVLGIDTWDIHWDRLQEKPLDSGRWWNVMRHCNDERIAAVMKHAETHIDLTAITSGATNELCLGSGFEQHSCLDFILQDLGRFPGQGERLIVAAFRSPSVRNRNMAVRSLAEWPRDTWSSELTVALQAASECEPNDDAKQQMLAVLRGDPLTD